MFNFVRFVAYTWEYFKGYFIVAFIFSKVMHAIYLKVTGYDKWYLGLVPFAHCYWKYELAGVSYALTLAQVFCTVMFMTSFSFIFFLPMWILHVLSNYKFACIYGETHPVAYSALPLGKYYIMIKEVINNAGNEPR